MYWSNPALVVDGFVNAEGAFLTRAEAVGIPREPERAELEIDAGAVTISAGEHEQALNEFGLDFGALLQQVESGVPGKKGDLLSGRRRNP
jgi:hypothetical protein